MRVTVYKGEGGVMHILLQPAVGRGLPPVYVRNVALADVSAKVLPVIEQMRRQEYPTGLGPPA